MSCGDEFETYFFCDARVRGCGFGVAAAVYGAVGADGFGALVLVYGRWGDEDDARVVGGDCGVRYD